MKEDWGAFLSGFLAAALFCLGVMYPVITESWRKDAVKRGFAEYNPTNGVWQWKEGK